MDYSQFLLLKEELSLILVIVILFVADLFMSPDAHKNDGKPVLNTMLPVALLTIHTLITIVPGPVADAFGGMYQKIPVKYIGIGEKIEDLQVFNREEFVDSLFS